MHQCPNCGVTLGFPLSHCHGGRCPKCHYKPGDHDKTKWVREPRYLVEVEKALRAAGFTDEKFIKEAKLRMQVKHDRRERESERRFTEWLSEEPSKPRRPIGKAGEAKYACFGCLFELHVSKQEVIRRLKIGSSIYDLWFGLITRERLNRKASLDCSARRLHHSNGPEDIR